GDEGHELDPGGIAESLEHPGEVLGDRVVDRLTADAAGRDVGCGLDGWGSAHASILPHALTSVDMWGKLDPSKYINTWRMKRVPSSLPGPVRRVWPLLRICSSEAWSLWSWSRATVRHLRYPRGATSACSRRGPSSSTQRRAGCSSRPVGARPRPATRPALSGSRNTWPRWPRR